MKKDQFYVGQRVKQKDPDDNCMVYGHVISIDDHSILIKWNDISEPCEHFENEYPEIEDGNPTN